MEGGGSPSLWNVTGLSLNWGNNNVHCIVPLKWHTSVSRYYINQIIIIIIIKYAGICVISKGILKNLSLPYMVLKAHLFLISRLSMISEYSLLKSKLVKNLDSCKCANISSILGISIMVIIPGNLFPGTVGNWVFNFLQSTQSLFVSCTGESGGHFVGTTTISEPYGQRICG